MFLKLPDSFDQNEWYIIILTLLNIILYKIIPKRFPTPITAILILYSISMPKILDHTIAVKPYSLYDLTDSSKYELFDVIMYAIYPIFSYLFIYIYDYFQLKGLRIVWYIIIWAIFSIGTEYIAVQLHVYNYTGWKLIYSLPVYTVILSLNILLFDFCLKHYKTVFEQK